MGEWWDSAGGMHGCSYSRRERDVASAESGALYLALQAPLGRYMAFEVHLNKQSESCNPAVASFLQPTFETSKPLLDLSKGVSHPVVPN